MTPTPPSDDRFGAADDVLRDVLEAEAEDAQEPASRSRWLGRLLSNRDVAILLVAVILFVVFALAGPRFLSENNLIDIARRAAILGILAVGMTYLFVAGELDLSIGSHYAFLLILMSFQEERLGIDPWLASGVVILIGLAIGAVNGLLVTRIGLPAFITTLGMLALLRGAANTVSSGYPIPAKNTDLAFYQIIRADFPGTPIPNLFVAMVVVMLIGGIVLARTKFGYHLYATGGNLEAARFAGINTDRVKLAAFILTGALCGLIGPLLFGYLRVAEPTTGTGFEFRVIGAVIVGGVALSGGRGTIYGSLMGALIISMITSGLVLLGFSQDVGDIATGALIIAAGTLGLVARRATSRPLGTLG